MTNGEMVTCPKCGHVVGQMRKVKGREMLVINGIVTTFVRGVCLNCGKEFHWDVGTRGLANLVNGENDVRRSGV